MGRSALFVKVCFAVYSWWVGDNDLENDDQTPALWLVYKIHREKKSRIIGVNIF